MDRYPESFVVSVPTIGYDGVAEEADMEEALTEASKMVEMAGDLLRTEMRKRDVGLSQALANFGWVPKPQTPATFANALQNLLDVKSQNGIAMDMVLLTMVDVYMDAEIGDELYGCGALVKHGSTLMPNAI